MSSRWQQIKAEWNIWRVGALPGLGVIAIVIAARLAGWLQGVEWLALDTGLRLRPAEPTDDRIVMVTFTERDFQQLGTVPSQISDRDIGQLLKQLQSYQPAVIGLDIFRDQPHEPGHAELETLFRSTKTLIGINQTYPTVAMQRCHRRLPFLQTKLALPISNWMMMATCAAVYSPLTH